MQFSKTVHTVTSAEETAKAAYVTRILPLNSYLKNVNLYNRNRGWNRCTIAIIRHGAPSTSSESIALRHSIVQCGLKNVSWQGDIHLETDYRVVQGVILNPTAADVIAMVVGWITE